MDYLQSLYNYDLVHLLIITSLVCGLEFCTASAFTYIPPILLKAGISETLMTWLMGCGPLLGFLLCPVVGHSSDRCRSRYGKRRPFILGFCLTIIFCLMLIPQSEAIGECVRFERDVCTVCGRTTAACTQAGPLLARDYLCAIRLFCSSVFQSVRIAHLRCVQRHTARILMLLRLLIHDIVR